MILIAGWFSFPEMGATAGDLMARDLVCSWLDQNSVPYDVALAPPFEGGVHWETADAASYSHVFFVCGPFGDGPPVTEFLARYRNCRLVGLDLTMLQDLNDWNPFELLLERDSSRTSRPDLAFLAPRRVVPVVGVVLIHPQGEYVGRDLHREMNAALERLLARRELAVVRIDTRLDENSSGQRTAAEVDSLIARMDVVVTTRLHGMVLALRHGIPALVLDPVRGGAKLSRQAAVLEWPGILTDAQVSDEAVDRMFDYCLSDAGRDRARSTITRVTRLLHDVKPALLDYLRG